MKAGGPANLERVEFYIDETKIGEVARAPFNLQFVTDNYPLGVHSLSAVGFTSDGQRLESKKISATFVSPSEGTSAALGIIIPILVLVFGAMLLAAIVPILTGRRAKNLPPGAARQYTLGGAICPKCSRPFGMHIYGINLLTRKLDRCPYCGHWGLVGRASPDQLRAAEQAELANAAGQVQATSEEEKLRKELDDSKFQNL
jgi:DNA-directed RNA polymerase subunit RPC12/RpoP